MDDHFRIRVGVEAMPAPLELASQLGEVIDFSIEDGPNRAVFVENRLMSAGNVDDAEAPHSQAGILLREDAFVVRAAMDDGLAHAVNGYRVDSLSPVRADDSRDSAHD